MENDSVVITIEVLKGGYVINYPTFIDGEDQMTWIREVITSPRKLTQRVKDLIEPQPQKSDKTE